MKKAVKKLVVDNIHLADIMAINTYSKSKNSDTNTLDDIRSAAYIGLIDAAHKYDPKRGIKFKTYAPCRIAGTIKDHWRTEGRHRGFKRSSKGGSVKVLDVMSIDQLMEKDDAEYSYEPQVIDKNLKKIEAREELARLLKYFRQYNKKFAFLFWKWAFKGYSFKDLSIHQKCSQSAVSVYMLRNLKYFGLNDPKQIGKQIRSLKL